MKKYYSEPTIETIRFYHADIITESEGEGEGDENL